MPKSAMEKIGASPSLLIAMIVLRGLHPGPVLDRPRDPVSRCRAAATRSCRSGRSGAVGVPAGVGRGTRGADGGTEDVGELLHQREALLLAQPTTAGDDDRGLGHLGPARVALLSTRSTTFVRVARLGQRHVERTTSAGPPPFLGTGSCWALRRRTAHASATGSARPCRRRRSPWWPTAGRRRPRGRWRRRRRRRRCARRCGRRRR